MKSTLLKLLFVTVLINYSLCWWATGHMIVAEVAKQTLLKEDPKSFELAEKLTSVLNSLSHNLVHNFVESSCWPDDLKAHGLKSMDNWHYINMVVSKEANKTDTNIAYTISDALGTLKQCEKILTIWKQSEVDQVDQLFEKSMMARYLVHVVGDIHQPLHTAAFFDNDKFKTGDLGGNLFKIKYNKIDNLHSLFDSGIGKLREINRPLTSEDSKYLLDTAEDVIKEFPKDSLPELSKTTFEEWMKESYDVTVDFIYRYIGYEETPSDDYINKAYEIVKKRIALAGYRLAEVLKKVKAAHDNPVQEIKAKAFLINQMMEFLK